MLDLKEERRYSRLRELAKELHIPMPEAFLTLEVFDKNGKLIQRHHQRSHSWVRNAYQIMVQQLALVAANSADNLAPTDTGGTLKSSTDRATAAGVIAGEGLAAESGEDTIGIVVGDSDLAESFEHYSLQSQIANGSGVGQLSYIASEAYAVSTVDTTKKVENIRYFNNNSGGDVDVKEVGLYPKYSASGYGNDGTFMTARDHLASTVTVPDTGQLKVTYTIQLTYPA